MNQYDARDKYKVNIPLGKMDTCEGVDYLSNAEFKGYTIPGPGDHQLDPSVIQTRHSSNIKMRVPIKGLDKSWRFEKTDKPDPGSYEHAEATLQHSSTIKRPPSVKFS